MKKIICLILVLTLVFTLCACGKDDVVDNEDVIPDVQKTTDVISSDDNVISEPESIENEIGKYITFGSYEQDNNISNGKEEIEWLVLDIQDSKALVISKYALDCKPYNTEYTDVTWETCTLRQWLNDDFINSAFSRDEQKKIQTTTVVAQNNGIYGTDAGNDTQDKIFLLSIEEVNEYFDSSGEVACSPTDFAVANGSFERCGCCFWWLRSPGNSQRSAARIGDAGNVFVNGYDVSLDTEAIRPAMWIEIG